MYCPSCSTDRLASDFCRNASRYNGLQSHCRTCRAQRHKWRTWAVGVLKKALGGCVDCGYNDRAEALDFDHLDSSSKFKEIAHMVDKSWHYILAEMAKCEIVCANCHRVRTSQRM